VIAVIFGPPGAGKGTQGDNITRMFGLPRVATGDMLRAEVEKGSALGREVEPIMTAGRLAPDDLVVRVIEERLRQTDAARGVLLDGFPRTVAQAEALDRMLRAGGRAVDLVLVLEVPREVLIERLLRRAEAEGRADDTPETIGRRLEVYGQQTAPVLDWYAQHGARVERVDGVGTIEVVRDRIRDAFATVGGDGRKLAS